MFKLLIPYVTRSYNAIENWSNTDSEQWQFIPPMSLCYYDNVSSAQSINGTAVQIFRCASTATWSWWSTVWFTWFHSQFSILQKPLYCTDVTFYFRYIISHFNIPQNFDRESVYLSIKYRNLLISSNRVEINQHFSK
jgi:hypothetical protein